MKRDLRFTWCSQHGKRRFHSRQDAKKAIRLWSRGQGMREYRCTHAAGCWHVGHLPPAVRYGNKTAREVYAREAKRQDHHWDHRGGDHPDRPGPVRRGGSIVTTLPVKLKIEFSDPEADASIFENCLADYLDGWLVVTDLTVAGVRKRHGFPAHTIDYVSEESL